MYNLKIVSERIFYEKSFVTIYIVFWLSNKLHVGFITEMLVGFHYISTLYFSNKYTQITHLNLKVGRYRLTIRILPYLKSTTTLHIKRYSCTSFLRFPSRVG